jgi:hypothetical protein
VRLDYQNFKSGTQVIPLIGVGVIESLVFIESIKYSVTFTKHIERHTVCKDNLTKGKKLKFQREGSLVAIYSNDKDKTGYNQFQH